MGQQHMSQATNRLNVPVDEEINTILIKLKGALELKEGKRLTYSEVVRMAIRQLAQSHAIQ
jgi:hypothetical protein